MLLDRERAGRLKRAEAKSCARSFLEMGDDDDDDEVFVVDLLLLLLLRIGVQILGVGGSSKTPSKSAGMRVVGLRGVKCKEASL